jgi:hypothetical protein
MIDCSIEEIIYIIELIVETRTSIDNTLASDMAGMSGNNEIIKKKIKNELIKANMYCITDDLFEILLDMTNRELINLKSEIDRKYGTNLDKPWGEIKIVKNGNTKNAKIDLLHEQHTLLGLILDVLDKEKQHGGKKKTIKKYRKKKRKTLRKK